MILPMFSPAENGPFLLVEASVCTGSATEGKQKTNKQKSSCRALAIQRSTIVMNGRDCDDLLLSCDSELKSDWDFQLSGSGSNSLNWRKLPGRFSLPKRPGNEAKEHAAATTPLIGYEYYRVYTALCTCTLLALSQALSSKNAF